MSEVVRFPVEQTRRPGEDRAAFSERQAAEQFWQANFASDGPAVDLTRNRLRANMEALRRTFAKWDPPILEDLANGRESE